nr:hypothetical protein [uncultured Holophaga sp.]
MKLRLLCLGALLLPELPLDPFRAGLPPSSNHPLGTDLLGRDGLLRLLHAGTRSCGMATALALAALGVGLLLALTRESGSRSTLRAMPPLLLLIPLSDLLGNLGWWELGALASLLLGLHLEPPLRVHLDGFLESPAWRYGELLGAGTLHRLRTWAPWFLSLGAMLLPSAWLSALWCETTLRVLGLGPGPQVDSLGILLQEELPRLTTDGSPLGWASLVVALGLAAASKPRMKETP